MIVHSSIFNFNMRQPVNKWIMRWAFSFLLLIIFILSIELGLRSSGWKLTTADTPNLWAELRVKASKLGGNGLIIVGASRSQLALDHDEIRTATNLEPIQLSIDGSSILPVIKSLADDPSVTSTILVSISVPNLSQNNRNDRAKDWVDYYEEHYVNSFRSPYKVINSAIDQWLETNLVSLVSGASPYKVVNSWLSKKGGTANYLTMDIERSRFADYSKVTMPDFYFARVIRQYGKDLFANVEQVTIQQFIQSYQDSINSLKPVKTKTIFNQSVETLIDSINKIKKRGGKVFLVEFPTDKMINQIIQQRYPREMYWNQLANQHEHSYHFSDHIELSNFDLPDGSHIDKKDKQRFTKNLLSVLSL